MSRSVTAADEKQQVSDKPSVAGTVTATRAGDGPKDAARDRTKLDTIRCDPKTVAIARNCCQTDLAMSAGLLASE